MGADLATENQEHCTAVPTEGKEDGKQDATLCCRISCCSNKDYVGTYYNSSTSHLMEQAFVAKLHTALQCMYV